MHNGVLLDHQHEVEVGAVGLRELLLHSGQLGLFDLGFGHLQDKAAGEEIGLRLPSSLH